MSEHLPARLIDGEWYVPVGDLHQALDALERLRGNAQRIFKMTTVRDWAETLGEADHVLRLHNRLPGTGSCIVTETPRWEVWVCPKHGICHDDGDFIEGQDPTIANAADPDGWTGRLYCGYSHDKEGCYQEVRQIVVQEISDSTESAS